MQSEKQVYQPKVVPPHAYQVGGSLMHNGLMAAPSLGINLPQPTKQSTPLHGVELQPLEVCPRNFIIFDQTDKRSRIMFHPALAQKFSCPEFDIEAIDIGDSCGKNEERENRHSSPTFKEDTQDIDALLSLEEEELEDEDEVSTARTFGSCGSNSTDSCSNYGLKLSKRKKKSSLPKQCSSSSSNSSSSDSNSSSRSERKRLRMKKMVKALRGIVPGSDQMNTVAVLDEAVRYLKSLKVEVKELGLGDLDM